jgi:hypothetical protein
MPSGRDSPPPTPSRRGRSPQDLGANDSERREKPSILAGMSRIRRLQRSCWVGPGRFSQGGRRAVPYAPSKARTCSGLAAGGRGSLAWGATSFPSASASETLRARPPAGTSRSPDPAPSLQPPPRGSSSRRSTPSTARRTMTACWQEPFPSRDRAFRPFPRSRPPDEPNSSHGVPSRPVAAERRRHHNENTRIAAIIIKIPVRYGLWNSGTEPVL